MESFEESVPGRLLSLAAVLPLAVGAFASLEGSRLETLAITGAVFGCIVLATFGAAMALEERPSYAIAAIVALPPALLLYLPLLALAGQVPIVRVAMGITTIALLGFLAKGVLLRVKPDAATPARRVAQHLT